MTTYTLRILGDPAPQGSKRAFAHKHTGKIVLLESSVRVKEWRELVAFSFRECEPIAGPVVTSIDFILKRPKALKGNPPHISKPDGDKLERAVWDGLTMSGVIEDDSRIIAWGGLKRYAEPGEQPGAIITVSSL